jgi:hypothetical protein
MPNMPELSTDPTAADLVLAALQSALQGGARVDSAAIQPIYDQLSALRARMSSDNRRPPTN